MLRDYNFVDALRREVDRIALPPESEWSPKASTGRGLWSLAALAIGSLAVAAVALSVVTTDGAAAGAGEVLRRTIGVVPLVLQPRPTPPVRPTVIEGGRRVLPVPNEYRNTQFRYNLVVPAWFHQTPIAVADSVPGLLHRAVFTARDEAAEARFAGGRFLPWDLIVEVYQRGDRTSEQWAGDLGCNRSGPAGASTCALTPTQIHGTPAIVGTRSAPLTGKMYLIERGDQILVLRYVLGDESNRPQDVTEATLDQIIGSLGLP